MKTTLIALSMLMASVAHAGEITINQLQQLLRQNSEAIMTVTPGMTAEYSEILRDDNFKLCSTHSKEVVMSVQPGIRYLAYVKQTLQSDCWGAKKGSVDEKLVWRAIEKPVYYTGPEVKIKSIKQEGTIVTVESVVTEDGETYEMRELADVSKSQFYANLEFEVKGSQLTRLLKTGVTDINTINTENLEIEDETAE